MQDLCFKELWIAFGSGKTFRYIPAHSIARTIGPEKSKTLLAFHALTGCDTVSSFYGHTDYRPVWTYIWGLIPLQKSKPKKKKKYDFRNTPLIKLHVRDSIRPVDTHAEVCGVEFYGMSLFCWLVSWLGTMYDGCRSRWVALGYIL